MMFLTWLLALMIGATLLAIAGTRATGEVATSRWRARRNQEEGSP